MTGGFNIKGREGAALSLSHLLYADDTIIFCRHERGTTSLSQLNPPLV